MTISQFIGGARVSRLALIVSASLFALAGDGQTKADQTNETHKPLSSTTESKPIAATADAKPIATISESKPKPVGPPIAPLEKADNGNIAIPRASLGKEFLLSASVIPQLISPTSTGLAGKIVRFELYPDGVDLYESSEGLVVTTDLPSRRLLTTFPIVSSDSNKIVIDFNKGMRRVFTDIWYGGGDFAGERERTVEVPQSRVFEVTQDGKQLVIRQSAQARSREGDADREERVEVRYFITPYQPEEFKTKEISRPDSRHVGYFTVEPQVELNTGRLTSKIVRFDISNDKPILFYYSANTPPDFVDAVKEGILYWNKSFGKEIVKAEKAPADVTAPDVRYNIIQWVPWDGAGFVYADALVDPRTGANQHGQAYITSVFAFGGKSSARELLRRMRNIIDSKDSKDGKDGKDGKGGGTKSESPRLGIEFLHATPLCQVDSAVFAQEIATGLESALADPGTDDAAILRLAQDYVREVVAHEVGHILGLAHNFAGSLAGDLSHKELNEWFHEYVSNPTTNLYEKRLTSSSVMEYNMFKSSVFIGHGIHVGRDALPYDRAAIQYGYFDGTDTTDKKMLYAMFGYGDVRTFDYGTDPVISAYDNIADNIKGLPNTIIETYIRAKAPRDPRDRIPLEEVVIRPDNYAGQIAGEVANILMWFKSSTRSVKVENQFDYISDLNHREVLQAYWAALTNQVDKVGGIDRLLFLYLPVDLKLDLKDPKDIVPAEKIDVKALNERVAKLLDNPVYTNFVGLDEKTNSFTKEEKALIISRAKKFFDEYEKEVVKRVCGQFEHAERDLDSEANQSISDDDIVAQLEKRLIDFSGVVITAKDESEHRHGKLDKSLVEVVDFKYDQDTRLSAARALADNIGSFKGWSTDAKSDLNKRLKDDVDSALNIQNLKDFQESMLSRTLRDWYARQEAILGMLPKKPGR